jgi:pimeloyl-ACP methyl ester carboxylesterase
MEHWAEDIIRVMDAAGANRVVIVGAQDAGHAAQLFAATHPERTTVLVLVNAVGAVPDGDGAPEGTSRSDQHQRVRAIDEWWGGTAYFHITAPSLTGDRALLKRLARQLRHQASPGTAQAILAMPIETDTCAILPTIGVPTLVLHAAGNTFFPATHGRYLAEQIPGARFVEIPACVP